MWLRRAAVSLLGMVLVGGWPAAITPAAAAPASVTVEITSVSVTGNLPTDEVEVHGRVSNPTGAPVYGLWMALWRSRDPIDSLQTLRQVTGVAPPAGVILPDGADAYRTITEQTQAFPAGAEADFMLRAPLSALGFDTTGAAYLVGARALGTTTGAGNRGNLGEGRTVIALPGDQPVPITRVVELAAPPTKLTDNTFLNEDLLGQLKGRLNTLLNAAATPGNSWLVDPALLDELTDMADGYQVHSGSGLTAGTGSQAAADWLRRFNQLDRHNGARSLFANPDITGALAARDDRVLTRALTADSAVPLVDDLPLVVLPTGGSYSTELGSYLADAPVTAVLATNVADSGAWQSLDGVQLLAASTDLGSSDSTTLQRRQYLEAATVITGAAGQLRLLREPADLAADTTMTTAWMVPRPLSSLLATAPSTTEAELIPAAPPVLDAGYFDRLGHLDQYFAAYGELVPESTLTSEADAALTRAAAAAWIGDEAGGHRLVDAIEDLVGPRTLAKAVSFSASPRFVMSSRSNEFPVTLTNNLDEIIEVKVVFTSESPQRLTVPPSALVQIAPGQSETVNIRPEANGNGIVRAWAHAVTESGSRVTPDTPITIEITDLGFIGWVLVVASAAVLALSTALRIRQVRRKNAAAAPPQAAAADTEVLDG